MTTGKLVETREIAFVEWVDAGVLAANWRSFDEVIGEQLDDAKKVIRSVGFVLKEDDDGVVLAAMLNDTHDDVGHAQFIPRPIIVRIERWTPDQAAERPG